MAEIGRSLEFIEGTKQKLEVKDYHEIKPESSITIEESRSFWDNLFSSEILEDDVEHEKKGGSYGEVFKEGEGDKYEIHHMPADSTTKLERNDGPAIKMEKADHRLTASCGNSREAREYRAIQKECIDKGNFREALQMDIDDIHEKFGDKYDDAISEMLEYVDKLEEEGKISE